jgi:Uma2 family endonuclease
VSAALAGLHSRYQARVCDKSEKTKMSFPALLETPVPHEAPPRKRFTRREVEAMGESGLFDGQRYELIDGDLIDKMGQKPRHSFAIQLLLDWLATFLRVGLIRVQLPIETTGEDREWSVPEPDIAVLIELKAEHQERHPRADELLLVIEVGDSSVSFDLTRKATLYARAGVPEYWVLDLIRRMLVVHRQPDGTQYRDIHVYSEDDLVSMEAREEKVRVGSSY